MVINVSFVDKSVKILFDKSKSKKNIIAEKFSKLSKKVEFNKEENITNEKANNNLIEDNLEISSSAISDETAENQKNEIFQIEKPKSPTKKEIFINVMKKVEPVELPTDEGEELSPKQLANIEARKEYKEHIKKSKKSLAKCLIQKENSPQKIATLFFNDDESDTPENFLKSIFSIERYFSKDFMSGSKKIKKSLILPDEIIGFDALMVPALNPLKINGIVKLKLSLNFKDFENLNLKFKQVLKVKPNVCYAVQFLKKQFLNELIVKFKNLGMNFKSINFYSSSLASFYTSKLHLSKHNALIVRVEDNHTTIMAVSHGFLVCTFSLACGSQDIINNKPYKADEHSKKMTAYKYICYEISNVNSSDKKTEEKEISLEKIEKEFPQTRTNLLAPVFQIRNIYCPDLVKQKIDEIMSFVKSSELGLTIDKIIIDTNNEDVFESIKVDHAEMVTFDETQVFAKVKQNSILKFSKIKKPKSKFSWSSLWKKQKKEA